MKVLLFGATGTAGGSVLQACLDSPAVEEVRAVVRRPLERTHPKLRVFVHGDYLDYSAVTEAFTGADACFFCLGISVSQVSGEEEYRKITQAFPLAAARTLQAHSPAAAFHYLSGQSASLNSRMMWARVKAEAERDLQALVDATCWRPGFIDGADSRNAPRVYQVTRPLFRLLRPLRGLYISGEDIGRAMIRATLDGVHGRILENREIRDMAERSS